MKHIFEILALSGLIGVFTIGLISFLLDHFNNKPWFMRAKKIFEIAIVSCFIFTMICAAALLIISL